MPIVKPTRRTEGLVVERLDGEVLVYDLERHRAHSLEPRAAAIWNACDGLTEPAALARAAAAEATPLDEDVVRVVLERLARAHLLVEPIVREARAGGSRRDLLRRAAALGGLAVFTVSVPTAAFAASCLPKNACVDDTGHDLNGVPCCNGFQQAPGRKCGKYNLPNVCR
jgi:hypothetical protein